MKIPLEWLKEYVDINISNKEVGEAFTALGLMIDKPFDGKVFDLEHRLDRADWLSILGCARDLAAYLKTDLKMPKNLVDQGKQPQKNQLVDIKVECPDVVNRFNTRVFRNIKVKPSPSWLKNRLQEYGMPSINNIVDITNYVMVEFGQPMHAQDLAKFKKQEIVIRKAKDGEKLCTLLGDEILLYPEAFVLTQDGVPTVLGGIVGGKDTGIDESTTDIILDAGNYNQNVVRRVSRKLKIQNETVLRYDKFLDPKLTEYAIDRAAYLILELAGGEYYQNIDWNPNQQSCKEMTLTYKRLYQLGGMNLEKELVSNILSRLGYELLSQTDQEIKVKVPYFRTDVEVEDDLISDVLRINGYSKIPTTPIQSNPPVEITPIIFKYEEELRDAMVKLGAHEFITDPLVSAETGDQTSRVILENSQNSLKNSLRTSIYTTLQEIIPNYTKNQVGKGILFEIGNIYKRDGDKDSISSYKEIRQLECLVFNTNTSPKELHKQTSSLLFTLLRDMGINNLTYGSEIYQGNLLLGNIRYNGFTLHTQNLLNAKRDVNRIVTNINTFNTLETSLVIPQTLPIGELLNTLVQNEQIIKAEFIEEYQGKEIKEGFRSILIKTYFKDEIATNKCIELVDKILFDLKKAHQVTIRS